jgi:Flp pilus assembly protein TadD
MLMLREAAHENESDPRLWVLYAVQCTRVGRLDTARRALAHAAWLRERRHEPRKAHVTRALLDRLDRAA